MIVTEVSYTERVDILNHTDVSMLAGFSPILPGFTDSNHPSLENTMQSKASAVWEGGLKQGQGHLNSSSRVLQDTPYSFRTRFEGAPGTSPEELIAAAHAGCFSMALSMILGEAGLTPQRIATEATVTLDQKDGGFAITQIHLDVSAKVPGASDVAFQDAASKAKVGCPVSKVLNAEISLNAQLDAEH